MLFTPKECDVDVGKLDAAAEEMLNLVSRISGMSGDMEDHFNNSAKEFSDLIAGDIYATASENQSAWGEALTACWHIFGVCTKWSGEVDRYQQNIDGLQEEWDSAVRNNFGYPEPDNIGIPEARRLKAEELNGRAATYWEELEGHAEDNTENIEGGPTISNLRELIDAGILGFAIYNSTRQFMYYPVTEGNGEEHAEDLREYIEGDKEPDAHYYHLLAQLATINGLALDAQRNGTQLRPDQIEYLEEFYATIDENWSVPGLAPTIEANEALSEEERAELMEALGGASRPLRRTDRRRLRAPSRRGPNTGGGTGGLAHRDGWPRGERQQEGGKTLRVVDRLRCQPRRPPPSCSLVRGATHARWHRLLCAPHSQHLRSHGVGLSGHPLGVSRSIECDGQTPTASGRHDSKPRGERCPTHRGDDQRQPLLTPRHRQHRPRGDPRKSLPGGLAR